MKELDRPSVNYESVKMKNLNFIYSLDIKIPSGKVVSTTRALLVVYCDVDPDT